MIPTAWIIEYSTFRPFVTSAPRPHYSVWSRISSKRTRIAAFSTYGFPHLVYRFSTCWSEQPNGWLLCCFTNHALRHLTGPFAAGEEVARQYGMGTFSTWREKRRLPTRESTETYIPRTGLERGGWVKHSWRMVTTVRRIVNDSDDVVFDCLGTGESGLLWSVGGCGRAEHVKYIKLPPSVLQAGRSCN